MNATNNSATCDRIDAALARIEAALATRDAGSDALERRHAILREAAASSLQMLDSLIAAHEDANQITREPASVDAGA